MIAISKFALMSKLKRIVVNMSENASNSPQNIVKPHDPIALPTFDQQYPIQTKRVVWKPASSPKSTL